MSFPLRLWIPVSLLLATLPAGAQWVSFTDATEEVLCFGTATTGCLDRTDTKEKDFATGDLDRDGFADFVLGRMDAFGGGAQPDVLLMSRPHPSEAGRRVLRDETAALAPGFLSTPTETRDVLIAELTGDAWPDVVIVTSFDQPPRFYRNRGDDATGTWLGLIDESSARFPADLMNVDRTGLAPDVLQFCAIAAGDVDRRDGLDLYLANYREGGGTTDVLLINDGSGNFTDETAARLGERANVAFGSDTEIRDLDDDGWPEIVKLSTLNAVPPFGISEVVLVNDGSGNFPTFQTVATGLPYMVSLADFDGDGDIDHYVVDDDADQIALADSASAIGYTVSDIEAARSPRTQYVGGNTTVADLDGDGDPDIGVGPIDVQLAFAWTCEPEYLEDPAPGGTRSVRQLALLRNPGDGRLFDPYPFPARRSFHLQAHDFLFPDLDGDGCLDLFAGLCRGWSVQLQRVPDLAVTIAEPTAALTLPAAGTARFRVRLQVAPDYFPLDPGEVDVRVGGEAATTTGGRVGDELWLSVEPAAGLDRGLAHDLEVTYTRCSSSATASLAGAVTFGAPELADTVLVMDVSGSMRQSRKMESAIQAASLYASTLQDRDRVGVIWFSGSDASGYGTTGEAFSIAVADPPGPVDNRERAIAALRALGPRSSTPIGEGLLRAVSEFAEGLPGEQNEQRDLVLLSDGLENVPNFWDTGPGFGWPSPPSTPVAGSFGTGSANEGVRIHTIALGPASDGMLMGMISGATMGTTLALDLSPEPSTASFDLLLSLGPVPAADAERIAALGLPSRLANIYEHVHNLTSDQVRLWQGVHVTRGNPSEPILSLGPGRDSGGLALAAAAPRADLRPAQDPGRDRIEIPMEAGLTFATLSFHWDGDEDFPVTLAPPAGQRPEDIEASAGPTHRVFRIQDPAPGRWIATVAGPEGREILATLSGRTEVRGFAGATPGPEPRPGMRVPIALALDAAGPLLGARVEAIAGSASGRERLELRDDGTAPDSAAGDGIYTGELGRTEAGGAIQLEILARWREPGGAERRRLFPLTVVLPERDRDGDGMSDEDELATGFLDPADPADALADPDGDSLATWKELILDLDPFAADTDGGGAPDGFELCAAARPDDATDDARAGRDSDGDGLPDLWEERFGLDPARPDDGSFDLDRDGLTDREELALCLSPRATDSDGDGRSDGDEVAAGTDPSDGRPGRETPPDPGTPTSTPAVHPYAFSLHLGLTIPAGDTADAYGEDLLFDLGFERRFGPSWSLEAVLGRYEMDPAFDVEGLTLYARRSWPGTGPLTPYLAFGPGLYHPEGGDAAPGLSALGGLGWRPGGRVGLEADAGYFHLFDRGAQPEIDFFAFRFGLRFRLR